MTKKEMAILILAAVLAVSTAALLSYMLPTPVSKVKDCADECHYVQPDTRSDKERCLDDSSNMFQAWRCKHV